MRAGGSRRSGGGLSSLLGAIGIQPAAGGDDNSDNVDTNNNNNNYDNSNGSSRKDKNTRECDDAQVNLMFLDDDEQRGIDDGELEASRAITRDVQEEESTEGFNTATEKENEKQDRIEWWRAAQKKVHEEHETLKRTINDAHQQQQQQENPRQTEGDSSTQSPSLMIPTFEKRSYVFGNMNRVDYDAMCKRVQEYNTQGGKKKRF